MNYTSDLITLTNFTSIEDIKIGDTVQGFSILDKIAEGNGKFVLFFESNIYNGQGQKAFIYSVFINENHVHNSIPFVELKKCKYAYDAEGKNNFSKKIAQFIQKK